MTTTKQETGTAIATTSIVPGTDSIQELLRELRTSEDLAKTPDAMRLLVRVERALETVHETSGLGVSQVTNAAAMKAYMDFGTFVSKGSATLPDHLKGNAADCTAIAIRADRWGLDFYGVAEKTHIIQGKLGYESQLIGAVMKNMGAIKEALHTEYFGDWTKVNGKFAERESKTKKDNHGHPTKYKVPAWKESDEVGLGIRVWTTLTGESEPRYLEVLMTQALVRNSTLWASNPQQQLFYLAQKFWQRMYAPQAMLGVHTVDDLQEMAAPRDMGTAEVVAPTVPRALLDAATAAAKKGVGAYQKFFAGTGQENRRLLADQHQGLKDMAIEADHSRTVDDTPAASTSAPAQTAEQAADPGTGEIDQSFVDAMDEAEGKKP